MKVSNCPILVEDWDALKKFLPLVPSFRFTSNPRLSLHENAYRIDYTIEVEDENKLGRYLCSLKEARDKAERARYKALSVFDKLKYLLAKRRERREKETRHVNDSIYKTKYWRIKDWWGKDYTY